MSIKLPAYKNYLRNRQNAIDAEKLQEMQKLDLYNEKTFYKAFVRDLLEVKKEVVIYSPFVTKFRSEFFRKTFKELQKRNIAVFIFTRPLEEQEYLMRSEIQCALKDYENLGVYITYLPGFIHAKTAIIDREILWEGSLNILSQRESREIMRRVNDEDSAKQVMAYLGINKKLTEGYKYQYEQLYKSLAENSKRDFRGRVKLLLEEIIVPAITWLACAISKSAIRLLKERRK